MTDSLDNRADLLAVIDPPRRCSACPHSEHAGRCATGTPLSDPGGPFQWTRTCTCFMAPTVPRWTTDTPTTHGLYVAHFDTIYEAVTVDARFRGDEMRADIRWLGPLPVDES